MVLVVEDGDLEAKVVVAREEDHAFDENAELGHDEVAPPREEVVMQHPCAGEFAFVDEKGGEQGDADDERCEDVGALPGVDGYRRGQAEGKQDQSGDEEEVANPIETSELLAGGILDLELSNGWVVQQNDDQRRDGIETGCDVPVGSEATGVVDRQGPSDQKADEAAQCSGSVGARLCQRPVFPGDDLRGNGVNDGLTSLRESCDGLPGYGHADRVRPRDDNTTDAGKAAQDDDEPFAPPVVGGLAHRRAQCGSRDGHGRGKPCAFALATDDFGDAVG